MQQFLISCLEALSSESRLDAMKVEHKEWQFKGASFGAFHSWSGRKVHAGLLDILKHPILQTATKSDVRDQLSETPIEAPLCVADLCTPKCCGPSARDTRNWGTEGWQQPGKGTEGWQQPGKQRLKTNQPPASRCRPNIVRCMVICVLASK